MTTAYTSATNPAVAPSHDEISQCAHELWTEAGQPRGRDAEFWLVAENRLLTARNVPDVTATIFATLSQPVTTRQKDKNAMPAKGRRGR